MLKKIVPLLALGVLACSTAVAEPWANEPDAVQPAKSITTRLGEVLSESTHQAADIVATAMSAIGTPYRYGGTSRVTGFDCSGFVQSMVQQSLGLLLPRRASEQAQATELIQKNQLQPGDLVFFNTMRRAFSHVGIYVGEGRFIHAPRTGETVRVDSLDKSFWQKRFDGARRLMLGDSVPPDAQKLIQAWLKKEPQPDTQPSASAE